MSPSSGEPVEAAVTDGAGADPARARATPAMDRFWTQLADEPWRYDFYYTMRRIEAGHPRLPLLGRAGRPADEAVRVWQEPSLSFAPSALASYKPAKDGIPPRIAILGFGMFGPNGPLPQHLTEYARDRLFNHADPTFVRFLDILHQRFILLFYRAWAQAQSVVSLDRPDDDAFTRYVSSLIALGLPAQRNRDAAPDHAKCFNAGHLTRETRNPEGLVSILSTFFGAGVRMIEFVGHWLRLAPAQWTRLGRRDDSARLGAAAVAGSAVWDRQSKFRLEIGPLGLAEYERFLPGDRRFAQLLAWVRNYIGIELAWDARLLLRAEEVPTARLGGTQRLGWTSWLGTRRSPEPAGDLVLDCEQWAARTAKVHQ